MGTLELLRHDVESVEELSSASRAQLYERLSVIEEGARRVRDIVLDLKALTVAERRVVGPIDVHRVLDVCATMAEHEVRSRAKMVCEYQQPLLVEADEARLAQVFLNLLINASQAIDVGAPEANEIRIATMTDGERHLVVEVRDTGVGIPGELRERVFEPFFTTRGSSGGTGLGLSISQSIVTSYGGTIDVRANEPRGTCLRVRLPRVVA
jgi:signal transduction histidine kinase